MTCYECGRDITQDGPVFKYPEDDSDEKRPFHGECYDTHVQEELDSRERCTFPAGS